MTVAELIAKLSEFSSDLLVVVPGEGSDEGKYVFIDSVRQCDLGIQFQRIPGKEPRKRLGPPELTDNRQSVIAINCPEDYTETSDL